MSEPVVDALFAGSARLGLLLGALELPWERAAPVVAAFPGELSRYQELSVSDTRADLGIMTRGEGQEFTFRVTHFMERHGIEEARLRRLLVTARYFEHRNLFFKVEVGPEGVEECSWYFRRRPELAVARAWLAQAGVAESGLRLLDQVAQVLGKKTVHFLGAAEQTDGTSRFKVYLSQPDAADSFQRLAQAARVCGVGDDGWAPLGDRMLDLAGHTAFFSLSFSPEALPGAKIDVHGLDVDVVGSLMAQAGRDHAALERVRTLLEVMERPQADYAGFRLVPGQEISTRVYALREAAPA